jgi:hypothetical protein
MECFWHDDIDFKNKQKYTLPSFCRRHSSPRIPTQQQPCEVLGRAHLSAPRTFSGSLVWLMTFFSGDGGDG